MNENTLLTRNAPLTSNFHLTLIEFVMINSNIDVVNYRAFPKEAKKEPRRRSSIPSPEKIGMTSKHLPFSR